VSPCTRNSTVSRNRAQCTDCNRVCGARSHLRPHPNQPPGNLVPHGSVPGRPGHRRCPALNSSAGLQSTDTRVNNLTNGRPRSLGMEHHTWRPCGRRRIAGRGRGRSISGKNKESSGVDDVITTVSMRLRGVYNTGKCGRGDRGGRQVSVGARDRTALLLPLVARGRAVQGARWLWAGR
jgi:hypothetical protein